VGQRGPAAPVDQQVGTAFFDAWAPAALALSDHALAQRRQQPAAIARAHHQALQRLASEAERARYRSEQGDPASRLGAAELEQRGEAALQALRDAQEQSTRRRPGPEEAGALAIPPALRAACGTLGGALPTLGRQDTVSRSQRQALLRCLIDKVIVARRPPDTIATRIVWRGGAVSALAVPCAVGALADLRGFAQREAQRLRLEAPGHADAAIAEP
jgi:hypothetical protein